MLPMNFDLLGGALCLDFINTTNGRIVNNLSEYLRSYDHLLGWSAQSGSISLEHAEHLQQLAAQHPDEATAALNHAFDVREVLYRIFEAMTHEKAPSADDIARFNAELAHAMSHAQVEAHDDHFHWSWQASDSFDSVLWSALRSAGDLLTDPDQLHWLRQCGGDTCDWLFLDTTKNHSRRWCDMKYCGNLMKVRKHRKQQQS